MTRRKHKKPNKYDIARIFLDENELRNFLEEKAREVNLILLLSMTKKHTDFSKELENVYFTPGTVANKDFNLIMALPYFFIIVPDNPKNRSAISILSHKHGLRLPKLTKFDEYMELAYQVKNKEEHEKFRQKIFNDVFKFIDEHYGLKNVNSISQLFLDEEKWKNLVEMFPSAEITSTAASLRDCTINSKGVIEPAKGQHVIFFRIEEFRKMSLQDAVYNFILSTAHELLHISGIKDEAKVHMLEFEISEKFLGIYHSEDFKNRKLREAKRILQISKS